MDGAGTLTVFTRIIRLMIMKFHSASLISLPARLCWA